jgi:hypothetical protein
MDQEVFDQVAMLSFVAGHGFSRATKGPYNLEL